MRVQMKLAGETIAAMDLASFYTLGRDWGVPRGALIEYVVDKYGTNYRDIDWKSVETPNRLPAAQSVQTAFELNERTVHKLDEIQKYFSEVFSAKRNVYKPFVIKMLFFKLINDVQEESVNEEYVVDSNVIGVMTCNFNDYKNKVAKEKRLSAFYQKMTGEEIVSFQEYQVGKNRKWLEWWKEDYVILSPEGIEKYPDYLSSVTLVKKSAFIDFKRLKLKTDKYWNRYVYGILTYTPNRRLRFLNIHIPQGVKYADETNAEHEARLKDIEELWQAVIQEVKDNIDCQEEWIVVGDFNAYEGSRFDKYLKELKLLLIDIDIDFHGQYITETWKDKKLDYIFVDKRTVMKFICEADAYAIPEATDHKVLTGCVVEKRKTMKGDEEIDD